MTIRIVTAAASLSATLVLALASAAAVSAREVAAGSPALAARVAGPQFAYVDGPTWYAIGGSFGSEAAAARRARELGGRWYVQRTDICTNYTRGLWIVAAGFFSGAEARSYANGVGGYAKECL